MFYRMNDGVAYVYIVLGDKSTGGKPLRPLEGASRLNFEYIGINAEEYNFARQNDIKIETRIRILQNKRISTNNVIKVNDLYYEVWRVRHSVNKFKVPITDITLVTIEENFEVEL